MFFKAILNKKFIPYIYILFLSCFSHLTFGQKNELILVAKDTTQNRIVSEIYHTKKHLQKKDALDEIDRILQQVKKRGFFTARIDSISKINKELIDHAALPGKIEGTIDYFKNGSGFIKDDSGEQFFFTEKDVITADKNKPLIFGKRIRFFPTTLGDSKMGVLLEVL